MTPEKELHPDFFHFLKYKNQELIDLYMALRAFLLDLYPNATEILYHTHALTSVYSLTPKLGDGFCMIPIYPNHLNLGFHKGTLLNDSKHILKGTGKLIRHIPITKIEDFNNGAVIALIKDAIAHSISELQSNLPTEFKTISKIKFD